MQQLVRFALICVRMQRALVFTRPCVTVSAAHRFATRLASSQSGGASNRRSSGAAGERARPEVTALMTELQLPRSRRGDVYAAAKIDPEAVDNEAPIWIVSFHAASETQSGK